MMGIPIWLFVVICILALPITLVLVFLICGIILGLMLKFIKWIVNIFKGVFSYERE